MIARRKFLSLIPMIIGVNIAVYIAWFFSDLESGFMARHFLVSFTALIEGRSWTLLTSVFSHNMFLHLLINMYVLNSFGRVIEQVLGPMRFFNFYLIAGLVSSLSHAVVSAVFIGEPHLQALGASGSIAGTILLFSLIFPKEKILIFGLIPMPALVGALLFIGLDLWGLFSQAGGGGLPIGHGAHLGGAFTGIIYYFFFLRRKLQQRRPY